MTKVGTATNGKMIGGKEGQQLYNTTVTLSNNKNKSKNRKKESQQKEGCANIRVQSD